MTLTQYQSISAINWQLGTPRPLFPKVDVIDSGLVVLYPRQMNIIVQLLGSRGWTGPANTSLKVCRSMLSSFDGPALAPPWNRLVLDNRRSLHPLSAGLRDALRASLDSSLKLSIHIIAGLQQPRPSMSGMFFSVFPTPCTSPCSEDLVAQSTAWYPACTIHHLLAIVYALSSYVLIHPYIELWASMLAMAND